jgi:protein involved in polysaccharide export with SLBB domain
MKYCMPHFPGALLALAASVFFVNSAVAQSAPVDARGLHASRAHLEQLLASYENRAAARELGDEERLRNRAEADAVRARLQEGDFQTGDQIALLVMGHPDLSETYTVDATRSILLPNIGVIPLQGVLRSELEAHLTEHLAQYVRQPRVRAESTIRLLVAGGVGNPGYYSVPSHALITDVLELAGGTGRESRLTRIRVERNGQRIIAGRNLQQAIIAGQTLDQLNIRAGDRVIVPERTNYRALRDALWVGTTVISTALFLTRLF